MPSKINAPYGMNAYRSRRLFHFMVVCLFGFMVVPGAWSATLQIRVNQVGYAAGPQGRAYLMTKRPLPGRTFDLVDSSGGSVYKASVGPTLGRWGKYRVYALDFPTDRVGAYSIAVGGDVSSISPRFLIDTPAHLYAHPLENSLYFYRNERDGENFIRTSLRTAPGHLNDAKATVYDTPRFDSNDNIVGNLKPDGGVIDAEGGWWDAGDYLKFVETTSYVAAVMLIGVRDFPDAMGRGSATSNFEHEAGFGIDFLQKMWNDKTQTLYYQVGIGTDFLHDRNIASDHDIWRLPQLDDTFMPGDADYRYIRNRPVFQAGPAGSKISPNLAGRLSADFAECYQVYHHSNPARAEKCLLSAEHIFDLADTAPGHLLTTAPYDFYPETAWQDDLELGATEIYLALRESSSALPAGLPHRNASYYLRAANAWAKAYIDSPNDDTDTFNLYDVSGLAHFELYRALSLAGSDRIVTKEKAALLSDLKKQLDDQALPQSYNDAFGFGYAWSSSDTISHGMGLVVMAKEYDYLTQSDTYATFARQWQANVLGANAWGVSFIVGDGTSFPDCMQHQVANIVGSLNGVPPLLRGAAVEGPTNAASSGLLTDMRNCPANGVNIYKQFNAEGAVYKDDVQSYSTDEPALDLTAASLLMFSWDIEGHPRSLGD